MWIYFGDTTVPALVVLPTVLAIALIGRLSIVYSAHGGVELTVAHRIHGGLAVVTLLTSCMRS